jgi:hypothetical protein
VGYRVVEIVSARLVKAVEAICAEDSAFETDLMDFEGRAWLLSGGMSFGGRPTAVYDDVVLVGD